jgi:hypothetical protein
MIMSLLPQVVQVEVHSVVVLLVYCVITAAWWYCVIAAACWYIA